MPETAVPKRFEADKTEWDRIADTQESKDLMATKKVFVIPAFVFFLAYYFLLPVLVGYAPQFMAIKVIGNVNLAYLFVIAYSYPTTIGQGHTFRIGFVLALGVGEIIHHAFCPTLAEGLDHFGADAACATGHKRNLSV